MWSLLMGLVIRLKFGIPGDLLSVLDAKYLATRPVNMFQTSSIGPEKAKNTVWVVKGNGLPLNPPTAQEVGSVDLPVTGTTVYSVEAITCPEVLGVLDGNEIVTGNDTTVGTSIEIGLDNIPLEKVLGNAASTSDGKLLCY